MYAARVVDALHLDMGVILARLQKRIVLVRRIIRWNHIETERAAPKSRWRLQILALAVDDEPAEPALVHAPNLAALYF